MDAPGCRTSSIRFVETSGPLGLSIVFTLNLGSYRSRASNTSLGFGEVALLAVITFLVNGLPVLIGLDGSELHWFPANAADWESWFGGHRGVRDVGHELVSQRESSDCTRGRRPRARSAADV